MCAWAQNPGCMMKKETNSSDLTNINPGQMLFWDNYNDHCKIESWKSKTMVQARTQF